MLTRTMSRERHVRQYMGFVSAHWVLKGGGGCVVNFFNIKLFNKQSYLSLYAAAVAAAGCAYL